MARKKKVIEPIVGPGKDPENKLTVQKSNPLLSLWRSDMSLAEFKILDTYLSRINSREPDKRTVIFTKGELEQLLGVKKINKASLVSRLKGLYRGVDIEDSNKKIHTIGLFEEAYGEMDENGLWTVKLTCTAKAMKYIFNIDKIGYLRYRLHSIMKLNSRYAYILFLHLEKNRTMHLSWEDDVDYLRQHLRCDAEPTYAQFKRFNDLVLKKCQKEIQEKTPCRFEYTPVKKGRKVTAVRFTLESIAVSPDPIDEGQLSLFQGDPLAACAAVLPESCSAEEVQAIFLAAKELYCVQVPGSSPTAEQIAPYLQVRVAKMKAQSKKGPIPHPAGYLLKMIENDTVAARKQAATQPKSGQRELSEDEILAIQRMLQEPDPLTAADDPDLAIRAEMLRESLQN